MPYTRYAVPDFNQSNSSPQSYQIGSFDAVAGVWMRVTISFNARPIGPSGVPPGTYYTVTAVAPDGTVTLLSDGRLVGGFAWYPGGAIGALLPAATGTYTLWYNTMATSQNSVTLTGQCQYTNFIAVVETPSALKPGIAPVTVMMLRSATVDPSTTTLPIGTFPAVAGQAYKLTCAFDASANGGTFAYNLSGSGFSEIPDYVMYDDPAWSKCYITTVVTAQDETCDVDLWTSITAGSASLYNCFVIAEPFVSPIVP